MERWQQQLQEILNEKRVVEEGVVPDNPSEQCPGFTFIVGPDAEISVTSIDICVLYPGQLQGKPERGTGTCLLMDTQCLPADVQLPPDGSGWVEAGILVEPCEPYVVRAIGRCCPLWYAPPGMSGVLAVMPKFKMLDLYDQLIYEYTHRYCSTRGGSQHTRSSGKKTFTLELSTSSVRHICGTFVLRQQLYRGELRRRGASIQLLIARHALVFRTLSGLPIMYCPTCGMKLSSTNTWVVGWGEWSVGS